MILRRGQADRRRWKRHWFNGAIRLLSGSADMHAIGIKISHGGVYLFAITDLPVGAPVALEFHPPQSRDTVKVTGTVRHRAVYLYGIEFDGAADSTESLSAASSANPT